MIQGIKRNIALCYVRQSVTRDENDMSSPIRQRENIMRVCEQNDWIPEWYEDIQGHKSGTGVKGRPAWQDLWGRIEDPDVIAIIANDMSRLHRRVWRIGQLIDKVVELKIHMIFADPSQHIDLTSPQGRMMAQFFAMMDENYALDISSKAKSSIRYRKSKGQSVGMPPFGTIRVDGYLQPSDEGAWLLTNGSWIAGKVGEQPPVENAVWRGYYEAAERILRIYATNEHGLNGIRKLMNLEGWAFRNRKCEPIAFDTSAVRRTVANWAEYGGYVPPVGKRSRARDRHAHNFSPETVELHPERAVFDIELLTQVGNVKRERATAPRDRGVAQTSYPYPLTSVVYCAHCERRAIKENDISLRTTLGGKSKERYRHKQSPCDCKRKSVKRDLLESDFRALIRALVVKPEYLELMEQLALNSLPGATQSEREQFEKKKHHTITQAKAKIQRVKQMMIDNLIEYNEGMVHIQDAEREISIWENKTTNHEKLAMELAVCADTISKIDSLWDDSDDADRQGMVNQLFDTVLFDLDKRRITGYRLKYWAENFVKLNAGVFLAQQENKKDPQVEGTNLLHTGLEPVFSP